MQRYLGFVVLTMILAMTVQIRAQTNTETDLERNIIIRLAPSVPLAEAEAYLADQNLSLKRVLSPSLKLVLAEHSGDQDTESVSKVLKSAPQVLYSQPDHPVQMRKLPNDESFRDQWNLHSTTQNTNADINALDAWRFGTGGPDVSGNYPVIAVIDGGVDRSHRQLMDNIWINANETPGNGIDDDENGFIDDINGWNAYNNSGNVEPSYHGTHVAGIIGARGNDGTMISGVNWSAQIMAISGSSFSSSIVLAAYGYVLEQKRLWLETDGARGANVVVTNSSFGVDFADCQSEEYAAWNDMYESMGRLGILSAAATVNNNINVDEQGDVPTTCTSKYIVAVTNTNSSAQIFDYAGFGNQSIDLGAPGTDILSTVPGDSSDFLTGTSMATPHVAGAVGFLHSVASPEFNAYYYAHPAEAALRIKQILLDTVDPLESLRDLTVSGGKLNLFRAAEAINAFNLTPSEIPVESDIQPLGLFDLEI